MRQVARWLTDKSPEIPVKSLLRLASRIRAYKNKACGDRLDISRVLIIHEGEFCSFSLGFNRQVQSFVSPPDPNLSRFGQRAYSSGGGTKPVLRVYQL
jgi:hypothetical protein